MASEQESTRRWAIGIAVAVVVRRLPVFPLLFGENNQAEMTALAQLTGGRTFDARTGSLADAFAEIRGYQ